MADYITTYSGIHFYPTEPQPEGIRIRDIAHSLSLVCRGNGHVKRFYSVGQHCIRAAREAEARGLNSRVVLACLLHDASEAYMSDVPRPLKKYLAEYNAMEEHMLDVIYTKFLGSRLTEEEEEQLRQIDNDLLYFDLTELLNEPVDSPAPVMHIDMSYQEESFSQVEEEYVRLYERIKLRLEEERNKG